LPQTADNGGNKAVKSAGREEPPRTDEGRSLWERSDRPGDLVFALEEREEKEERRN
jgi:hypothetical protein